MKSKILHGLNILVFFLTPVVTYYILGYRILGYDLLPTKYDHGAFVALLVSLVFAFIAAYGFFCLRTKYISKETTEFREIDDDRSIEAGAGQNQ